MSARDVLDQRLARGEITEEEYDRLLAKIGTPASTEESPAPEAIRVQRSSGGVTKKGAWWFIVIGGAIITIVNSAVQDGIREGRFSGFSEGGMIVLGVCALAVGFGIFKLAFGRDS